MKHLFIKDNKKRQLFAKNEKKYLYIKYLLKNELLNNQIRIALSSKFAKLNKTISLTKIRNRCSITFRSRGNLTKFKLSRIQLRQFISLGLLPGYKKSIW